ncbi:MAG: hypothetical protein IJH37_08015 [Clostridia bacterium]|nr:hypothetical protein [Clostridia bacterium]
MDINELLKGQDLSRLKKMIGELTSRDRAELLKKLGSIKEQDIDNLLGRR